MNKFKNLQKPPSSSNPISNRLQKIKSSEQKKRSQKSFSLDKDNNKQKSFSLENKSKNILKAKVNINFNKKKSAQGMEKKKVKDCQSVLKEIQKIDVHNNNKTFQQSWVQFRQCIDGHIKQIGMKLSHETSVGQKIMQNGNFWIKFSQIVKKNTYVSQKTFLKCIYQEHGSKVIFESNKFTEHFMGRINQIEKQTISIISQRRPSLKRSIIKSTSAKKKVGFPNKQQLHYLADTSYSKTKNPDKQQRLKQCKNYLQAFNITQHDFYLINQIQIMGIIENYKEQFGIIQFRDKKRNRIKKGVTVLNNVHQWDSRSIKKLSDRFKNDNLSFVDLKGKSLEQVWMDHLEPHMSSSVVNQSSGVIQQ